MKSTPRIIFRKQTLLSLRFSASSALKILSLFFLLSFFSLPSSARASCFNPSGNAGDTIYNGGYTVIQYCNGGAWINIGHVGNMTGGLAGWWKLDDGAGTSAADSSGNGNTGATQSGPTWTTNGMNGGALTLNGTTQYVLVSDAASLQLAGSWTVSSWINLNALPASGTVAPLLNKNGPTSHLNYGLYVDNGSVSAGLGWVIDFNKITSFANHFAKYVTTINTGTWYHVAGVYDSVAQTLTVYLNGVSVATNSVAGFVPASGAGSGPTLGAAGQFTNGTIDDSRVYNRALSAADIKTLYTSTGGMSGDIYTGLTGYWKFDEGSGTVANDSSTNGNTGTLVNGPTWTGSGKVNGALSFAAASSQYVDVANPSNFAFDYTQPFSISAWVYRTANTANNVVAAKWDPATTKGYKLWLPASGAYCNGSGSNCLDFIMRNGGTSQEILTPGGTLSTNAWHHVVATYDGSQSESGMKLYIDGAATGNSAANNLSGSILTSVDFKVAVDDTTTASYFPGTLDEVRVYNRVLSPSDVLTLYNSTATACSGPTGYAGDEIYNNDANHVMQYCNGSNWELHLTR